MSRDDFSEAVKRLVAARTGYRCSSCKAHTSGPQAREDGALNVGEAAHISAAASGGPRFDPSLSPEQRSSFSNAIWLCRICAKLIDNDLERFPRQLLVELKQRAEADAYAEVGKPQTVRIESPWDLRQAVKDAIAEGGPSPTQFDIEIDSAVGNINQFKFEGARILLERLKERHWVELSDRQRFRVVTNIAATFLGEADRKRAAEGYRAAKRYQPDDQKAWENEALAHELLGEKSEAIRLAREIRARWPESVRAVSIILAELPPGTTIEQLESEIPAALVQETEICMIMSRRAAALRDFASAEQFAREALNKSPNRAQAVFLLGQVMLGSLLAESWSKHGEIAIDRNSSRLTEAETHLTRAISLAKNEKAYALEANALVTRSCLYEIKGEKVKSEEGVEQAYHVSPDEPHVLASYAKVLHSRGDTDRAILALRQAMKSSLSEEASFLLSDLLRQRGTKADLQESLSLLIGLATGEPTLTDGFREHVASCAMYLAKELDDFEQVDQLLDKIPEGALSASALQILRIRLALAHGQQEQANKLADDLLRGLSADARANDRRNLAMVLSQLSRFEDALPLWQQIVPPNVLGNDTKYLLDCAMRTERHGLVLDVCKSLRAAGVDDREVFATEMAVLERFAPQEALELLRSEVLKRPDDRVLQLQLSILGLRLNRPEVVVSDIAKMPPTNTVSPRDAIFAVAILRSRGDPNDAVRYAYEVLRFHFGDVDAHRAYVSAMGPGQHSPSIPGYDRAAVGCAVRFVTENSQEEQCTIIEDCVDPDPSRNEISPDSTLAKELLGRQVGDSFRMSAFSHGRIKEITSKFIFRYQDCGKQWQFRFSDKPDLLAFGVGNSGNFETDFEPIMMAMRARRERVEEVKRLYSTNVLPIHLVGVALGVNDFEALAGLAGSPDVVIRCCAGSQLEREAALSVLNDRPRIVADITAIGTLVALNRLNVLFALPFEVTVASGTMAVLEEMLRDEESHQEHSVGFLTSVGERPQFVEKTEAFKHQRLKDLRSLLDTVRSRCGIRNCAQLAYLEPEKRNTLVKLFGLHGAESVILSSEPGCALWTDDLAVAGYAREIHAVNRVWTQLLLQDLAAKAKLDDAAYSDATARLAGLGYFFTSINIASVLAAGRMAGWNPDKWPLRQTLRYLQLETIELRWTVNLVRDLIVKVFAQDLLADMKNAAVIGILENLAKREKGLEGILAVRKTLAEAFGLNAVAAIGAGITIDAWLAATKNRIVRG